VTTPDLAHGNFARERAEAALVTTEATGPGAPAVRGRCVEHVRYGRNHGMRPDL